MSKAHSYSFSFTAASLRPELVSAMAEQFLRLGSWEKTKEHVLASNILQCRSAASAVRMEREIRHRIQNLTPEELQLIPGSTMDVCASLAWLGAAKHSLFLFEFASEVLRTKLEIHDPVLRASDYERFTDEKVGCHPEILKLSASSAGKVRRVLMLMLREVGLLVPGTDLGIIQRSVIPPDVERVIRLDHPKWLASFLLSDAEILKPRSA